MYVRKARFTELRISIEHAQVAGGLPGPHRDPVDRMLIAQAQLERLKLLSADSKLGLYDVEMIAAA